MTRNEEILKQAVKEQSQLYTSSDWRAGFISGAKWADKHPNLYNDEKYQTVKVSQLDELNRKAKLYDEVADKLHELLKACSECFESQINFEKYITEHMTQIYKEMEK